MGLDLIPESCAKSGHEAEWRRAVERTFEADQLNDEEMDRFAAISVPPYAQVGAPRVGHDPAADAWIAEVRGANTPEEVARVLREFDGYYALKLAASDGLPKYSHGGLYEGVDETSFRGSFLTECSDVLERRQIDEAWEHKWPEAAASYGRTLLAAAAAAAAEARGPVAAAPPKPSFLAKLGLGKQAADKMTFAEQLEVVRTAGRWYVFWGDRGHPIRAWS